MSLLIIITFYFYMRLVIQRVNKATVKTPDGYSRSINKGIMVLVGITHSDTREDAEWLAVKIAAMRIFDDEDGVMNLSIKDIDGEVLIVSQFTLHARVKKGNRPSYMDAAPSELAIPLYKHFISCVEAKIGKPVPTGVFGANMDVELVNNGPVTILIDTENKL